MGLSDIILFKEKELSPIYFQGFPPGLLSLSIQVDRGSWSGNSTTTSPGHRSQCVTWGSPTCEFRISKPQVFHLRNVTTSHACALQILNKTNLVKKIQSLSPSVAIWKHLSPPLAFSSKAHIVKLGLQVNFVKVKFAYGKIYSLWMNGPTSFCKYTQPRKY